VGVEAEISLIAETITERSVVAAERLLEAVIAPGNVGYRGKTGLPV
jgi:hypothetical protein